MKKQITEFGKIVGWDGVDVHRFYQYALRNNPVIYDDSLRSWLIYSYMECKAVLMSDAAEIPLVSLNNPLLSDCTKLILKNLARLSNGGYHTLSREAAYRLFNTLNPPDIKDLMSEILPDPNGCVEINWVSVIGKRLPVLYLAQSLGFNSAAANEIVEHIGDLVKIMSPNKTDEEIMTLNRTTELLAAMVENLLNNRSELAELVNNDNSDLMISNLLGLLIQSYDAGRGLLSNILLRLAGKTGEAKLGEKHFFYQSVIETLRFDPPVHFTRRQAVQDIRLNNILIKKGEQIYVMLAAANLDPKVFNTPMKYDIERLNNSDHLTFGAGGHNCLAKHFMIDLTVAASHYLFKRFDITMVQNILSFEKQLNVRLIKELHIQISNSINMIAVIFEVEIADSKRIEYLDIAADLKKTLVNINGFVSIERFQSLVNPEKLLSLSFWKDEKAILEWRNLEVHRMAQAKGRTSIFKDYHLRIGAVVRDYGMYERTEAPSDSEFEV